MKRKYLSQKLPKVYKRNNKKCYLDPVRKKLIYVTKEETIRQKVLAYLINELGVPVDMIEVESHLKHYGLNSKLRADIVILGYDKEEDAKVALAVIECKEPQVTIDDTVVEQAINYADLLGCWYTLVTNGIDEYIYYYNDEEDLYYEIKELPTYKNMIKGYYELLEIIPDPPRLKFDELEEGLSEYRGVYIGEYTNKDKALFFLNFFECLLDKDDKLIKKKFTIFEILEDYGLRFLTYSNASGGTYWGTYRSFIISYNKNTVFVSIGVSTYVTWAKQDIEKTVINIGLDADDYAHHSLQLVEDNISIIDNKVNISHHGRIAVGNIGSGKISDLKLLVSKKYPKILVNNIYNLGCLTNDKLFRINDKEVTDFIENLISYALIRDDYRSILKEKYSRKV